MPSRSPRLARFAALTFALLGLLATPMLLHLGSAGAQDGPDAQAGDVGAKVGELLGKMDRIGLPGAWDRALELEKLGAPAAPEIAKRLESARLATKLAGAKVLLALDTSAERPAAIRALKD